MSETRSFKGEVQSDGRRCWIELPFDPDTEWGVKRQHHISGTVAGHDWRGPVQTSDGTHKIKLGPAWMRDCPISGTVEVELSPEGPRRSNMGDDVFQALDAHPDALAFFEALPSFYRNNFDRWISQAKRPETRQRRIDEMVKLLRDGKRER